MAEMIKWASHQFLTSSAIIRSINDFEISAGCDTENKTVDGQTFASRKNNKPTEIKLTIPLHAQLGVDVQAEALAFESEARAGTRGYFYAATKKLFPYELMLVSATIKNKVLALNGKWLVADVDLTLKQCTKTDGKTTTQNSTPAKASVKTNNAAAATAKSVASSIVSGVTAAVNSAAVATKSTTASKAKQVIQKTVAVNNAAKIASAVKKAASTAPKGGGGSKNNKLMCLK